MNKISWFTKRLNRVKNYQHVFSSDEGQSVLYDLMQRGHIIKPVHSDIEFINHKNEGKREMVLYILEMLKTDPDKLLKVIENGQSEEESYG